MSAEWIAEPWDSSNPFSGAVFATLGSQDRSTQGVLRLCSSKYEHLAVIWWRLQAEAKVITDANTVLTARARANPAGPRPLDLEENLAFMTQFAALNQYSLDHEDLLLHSRILLDRIAHLAHKLIGDRQLPWDSFADQRKCLCRKENIPYEADEEYAGYVRDKTRWFGPLIKDYRDDFIVHNQNAFPFGILSGPAGFPRPFLRSEAESHQQPSSTESLLALREKYASRIPNVATVVPNVHELVEVFEKNANRIDESDLRILTNAKRLVGSKLPDPNEVKTNLQDFVRFVDQHFLKESGGRFSRTPGTIR